LDEVLRDIHPELVETHELIDNPDGPKTMLEAAANSSFPFLLVERTKPPEWLHAYCECGHQDHYHSPACPFERCDCQEFRPVSESESEEEE
jgi:hypothetical protein